jgi:saccharopine dehydrogenase-like NADP-dependent oxidoreductase
MATILVLGTGLVGQAMAKDLADRHKVIAADISRKNLEKLVNIDNITTVEADLTDKGVFTSLAEKADFILGALPGFMGYESVKKCIEAGKDMVDISFFPEDPFALDRMAKDRGVTIITDCGVAPGMSNLMLGHYSELMQVQNFRCLVGGLPEKRELPWQYRAVFSPIDVIEEYTRPARYMQNGEIIVREALTDLELVNFDSLGTLESFNSDGLRSLLDTMKVPNMIEKTMRYPGTVEFLYMLREAGFFSDKEIMVGGKEIKPVDFTASLVFPQWEMPEGEVDITVMRINIEGWSEGRKTGYQFDLLDRFDTDKKISSMARTTGYTATAVMNLLADGNINMPGINPPELIGKTNKHLPYILNYLKERNVLYRKSEYIWK